MSFVLLVTGFGPFENYLRNPSSEVAEAMDGKSIAGVEIVGRSIQVSWRLSWDTIQNLVEVHKPDCLLCLGVAPDPFFRLETMAKNSALACDDVHGLKPRLFEHCKIVDAAPPAYWSTLPIDWLLARLQRPPAAMPERNGSRLLPVARSLDAGWYLCNYVFFHAMHYLQEQVPYRGFVHIPPYPNVSTEGGMTENDILQSGMYLVEELARWLAFETGATSQTIA